MGAGDAACRGCFAGLLNSKRETGNLRKKKIGFWGDPEGCGGRNQWYHFGVGEFTTHFRTYFSGWIGVFTGGKPIWLLTHGNHPRKGALEGPRISGER